MLIVLYGGTGYVGRDSRKYFEEKGFEVIQKINYMPDSHVLKARYEPRKAVTLEEVQQCDFVYEHPDGIIMGFNKAQIIDAVWGRKNCLLSFSTENTDFIEQIKSAYGDFATVIGTYIEQDSLRKIFSAMGEVPENELSVRMRIGEFVKKNMSEKRRWFDDIVIYNGEDGAFNMQALYKQYDSIIEKALAKEKAYKDRNYVALPYTGSEPYVFISYSHADIEKVRPVLSRLQLERCRIWFDEGIDAGQNWRNIISSKIESPDCKNFILFMSERSVESDEVTAELESALDLKKNIIAIHLDNAKYNSYLNARVHKTQSLDYGDSLVQKLIKGLDRSVMI